MDRRDFLKASLASTAAAGLVTATAQTFAQAGKPPTIAFFVKNVTNPFWKACRIGAEKAAKDLGVNLEVVAPTKPDNIEEQTRLVEDWIVQASPTRSCSSRSTTRPWCPRSRRRPRPAFRSSITTTG